MNRALTGLATTILSLTVSALGEERVNDPTSFTWNPELSTSGPVVVIVDLKTQRAAVYRNGVQIGACIVSTGMPGHETPTGVFHILEKDADHHSSIYNNASMPFSERLTWGGVALHAGSLPGYPSSHGCIHLPYEFSKKLFEVTSVGGTVIISNDISHDAVTKEHRIQFTGEHPSDVALTPHKSPQGPVSIMFSSHDNQLLVVRNGVVIGSGRAQLKMFAQKPHGTYTYVCDGWTQDRDGSHHPHWHQVSGPNGSQELKAFTHLKTDPRLQHVIDTVISSGTTLVITDEAMSDATRSQPGFFIMQGSVPKK